MCIFACHNGTDKHCACRLYIEQYSSDVLTHSMDAQEALAPIIKLALDVSQLTKFTGRENPTVIT